MSARVCRTCGPYYSTLHECPVTATDRTSEPAAVFEPLQATWEAREVVDIAEDVRVEAVARAIYEADSEMADEWADEWPSAKRRYRRLAAAALAADAALQPSPVARVGNPAATVERMRALADELERLAPQTATGEAEMVAADTAARIRAALDPSR